MHYKITVSRAVFMSFAVVLLVLISLVCLAPLWHVLMGSLSNPTQVGITQGLILYPLQNLDTHAYSIILTYQRLWNGYLNTFIYIFLQCVLTGVATIVAGYVWRRSRSCRQRYHYAWWAPCDSADSEGEGREPSYPPEIRNRRGTFALRVEKVRTAR